MEAALRMGHIESVLKKVEKMLISGEADEGLKILLKAATEIRLLEKEVDDKGVLKEKIPGLRRRCEELLQKTTGSMKNAMNRPVLLQPGRQMVKPDDLLMVPDEDLFLSDIVGMNDAKLALIQAVLLPNVFKGTVPVQNLWSGILLFGGSGVGKSKVVRAFINSIAKTTDVKINFLNVTLDQVCGAYFGDTERNLSAIFKAAESKSPCIILIDEVDALCSSREKNKRDGEIKITNHFLYVLDGLNSKGQIVVIGTTNKPYNMDPAFYRRFQKKIYIELPNKVEREELLKKFVGEIQPFQFSGDIDFVGLAEGTFRFSPADLRAMVTEAVQTVRCGKVGNDILRLMEANEKVSFQSFIPKSRQLKYRLVSNNDLRLARKKIQASNVETEISKLDTFANLYCNRIPYDELLESDCHCCTTKQIMESPLDAFSDGLFMCMRLVFGDLL